ncbi:MAG: hypothetical protein LBF16_07060 [Pseudomonadales bacterium]|jgi:transposase-like protein|nr:hypothetical protein [Pseudomonadales bacterium]
MYKIPHQKYTMEFKQEAARQAENARLQMENEILKKATAYFARESL